MKHPLISRRTILAGAGAGVASILGAAVHAQQRGPIRIGFLAPLSGVLTRVGETSRNALTLAAEEINAAGGLLGQKVEVVVEDSQMSAKVSLDKSRKLVGRDDVAMITGMVLPFEREAALQVASPAKRLVVFPNFDEGRCHPHLLTTGLAMTQRVQPAMEWALKNAGKKVVILVSDLGTYRNALVPQLQSAVERFGGSVLAVRYFPFGTTDYGPVFQQIQGLAPDVVWHTIGDDPVTFVKQYRSFGMKPQLVTDIAHESLAMATEAALTGTVGVSHYFMSLPNEANRKFLDAYTKNFPRSTPLRVGNHVVMMPTGESTFVGAMLFAEAVRKAGSIDADKVKAALASVTLEAPRGTVRVADGGTHLHCLSYLGRARADAHFDLLGSVGPVGIGCLAT